ncbi:hypothetical protein LH464_05395 [Neorhizobium sp. T786]|uniref:hypothetical protein n=1 Tax=Pseudorhizobium xiangyangii TaxID=2883104 RepID=UPI001CFFA5E3|nr:hypothetical protein [Neorhizobium xiangyangii]MCB5201913.1 hypothetical protein [Neorhizobium xiangyangii]
MMMKPLLNDNHVTRVRELIDRGFRLREIAERLQVLPSNLAAFMQRHDIHVIATGKVPPPDLSREDRTVVFTNRTDPVSGAARIKRASLPAITMHRQSLCETWGITQ